MRGPRAELELRSEVLSLAVWPVGVRLRLRDSACDSFEKA